MRLSHGKHPLRSNALSLEVFLSNLVNVIVNVIGFGDIVGKKSICLVCDKDFVSVFISLNTRGGTDEVDKRGNYNFVKSIQSHSIK